MANFKRLAFAGGAYSSVVEYVPSKCKAKPWVNPNTVSPTKCYCYDMNFSAFLKNRHFIANETKGLQS